MKFRLKRSIPNFITALRMAGSVCLLLTLPFSLSFFVFYTLCGVTDVLDGWLARMTKTADEFGARLDSIADLLFYMAVLVRLVPALWERLPAGIWYGAGGVFLLRMISYLTAVLKYHSFAALHTYLNKLSGLVVFVIPFFAAGAYLVPVCVLACLITGAASAEELLIHLRSVSYEPDIKTILSLFKGPEL